MYDPVAQPPQSRLKRTKDKLNLRIPFIAMCRGLFPSRQRRILLCHFTPTLTRQEDDNDDYHPCVSRINLAQELSLNCIQIFVKRKMVSYEKEFPKLDLPSESATNSRPTTPIILTLTSSWFPTPRPEFPFHRANVLSRISLQLMSPESTPFQQPKKTSANLISSLRRLWKFGRRI